MFDFWRGLLVPVKIIYYLHYRMALLHKESKEGKNNSAWHKKPIPTQT